MSDEEKRTPPKLDDYFVDVGLPADRVRELVRPGDVVTRERGMARLGDLVTCKSLDNRAGLYVMIEAVRALGDHECEVVAVASVQEEVGLRGARVAASRLRPRIGLAIDITLANDGPEAKPHERVTTLGGGAAVKVYDTSAIVPARGGRPPRGGRRRSARSRTSSRSCRAAAPTRGSSPSRATAPRPAASRSPPATSTRSSRPATRTTSTPRCAWWPPSARPPRPWWTDGPVRARSVSARFTFPRGRGGGPSLHSLA